MVEEGRICLRRGSEEDLDAIVTFSQRRRQEQRQDDSTDIELKGRMLVQLSSEFVVFLFEAHGKAIGYSLVSRKADPLSIMEYYLDPEERGKGYGYEAIAKLLDATDSTSIDVSSNAWREAAGAM